MHRPIRVFIALVAWVLGSASLAQNPSLFEYVVLTEDKTVGSLTIEQQNSSNGQSLKTQLNISENGRGPSRRGAIEIDAEGQVVSWTIEGRSTLGAEVNEAYHYDRPKASWSSLADSGQVEDEVAPVYVPQNASDWLYAYLIRQAKRQDQWRLDILPRGQLQIEQVTRLPEVLQDRIDSDLSRPSAIDSVYMILGLDLAPIFVVLDHADQLVARLGARQWVLRADLIDHASIFMAAFTQLTQERLQQLAARLQIPATDRVVYDRVHLILPTKKEASPATRVVVDQGMIVAIDPAAKIGSDDTVIDGQGGYLMPGLFDMHVHTSPWSGLYHLAAGVTSVRDQGTPAALMRQYLDWQAASTLLSPTLYPSGFIEGLSPYSSQSGEVVDSLDVALASVDRYAGLGYRQIKIYNSIAPEWVRPMIERAHVLGLKVTGHVPAFMTADEAIVAGYDDISHLNQLMLGWVLKPGEDTRTSLRITAMTRVGEVGLEQDRVQQTLDKMVAHQVALDTTAMILERVFLSRSGQVNVADQSYLDHMPIGYQRFRRRGILPIDTPVIDQAYRQAFDKTLEVLKAADERGVTLLPGTDDGIGFSLHRELELYVQAGIQPSEAIEMATLGAAQYLGVAEQVGSIEIGKQADFILLRDNPLDNISATRTVRLVSKGSLLLAPATIHRALGVRPFIEPPPIEQQISMQ